MSFLSIILLTLQHIPFNVVSISAQHLAYLKLMFNKGCAEIVAYQLKESSVSFKMHLQDLSVKMRKAGDFLRLRF